MTKERNRSTWAQEVQFGEIYGNYDEDGITEDMLGGAYEALNRFCQKEQRRSKFQKKGRQCWQ